MNHSYYLYTSNENGHQVVVYCDLSRICHGYCGQQQVDYTDDEKARDPSINMESYTS